MRKEVVFIVILIN